MTWVDRRFHRREPSERLGSVPHRARRGPPPAALAAVVAALVVGGIGCSGAEASVGVTVDDGDVVVLAKACDDVGIGRVDVVDPVRPEEPVWRAVVDGGPARRTVIVAEAVPGYRVTDARPDGTLPDRPLRVLVEGTDGTTWGGPRIEVAELRDGTLRVAGRDVPLEEWRAEPAACPEVGLGAALLGGLATAAVAAGLWLAVRVVARAVRRRHPDAAGSDAA